MKHKLWFKVFLLTLTFTLIGTAVYAGTVIKTYKTNRGDYATVEKEEVHKNRIALKVNGKNMKTKSWYANGVTYVPIREAAEMLGAQVNYVSKTQTAEINSQAYHPKKIVKQSDLPYTMKTKDNYVLTINSFKATTDRITINITARNGNTKDNAIFHPLDWRLYENNKRISLKGMDDYLSDHLEFKPGETVEGDVYFDGLSSLNTKSITTEIVLWHEFKDRTVFPFEMEIK